MKDYNKEKYLKPLSKEYKTITQNATYELQEKKSKFIADLIYIQSKEDAENKIKEYKKKYFDARHNCYAYRVLENEAIYEKLSDDRRAIRNRRSTYVKYLAKE